MSIQEKSELYEVLFRIYGGVITGAHRKNLNTISNTESGTVYPSIETDPIPITGEDLPAVLGELTAILAVSNAEKDKRIDDLLIDISTGEDLILALNAQVAQLSQDISELQGRAEINPSGEV